MSDQPQHLIDRLREIEGYENASQVAYDLLFDAMEDIDSDFSLSIQKVSPNIKRIRSYKILNNTNKDTKEKTARLLRSLLKASPFADKIEAVDNMSFHQLEDCFFEVSKYWIEELYKIKST